MLKKKDLDINLAKLILSRYQTKFESITISNAKIFIAKKLGKHEKYD